MLPAALGACYAITMGGMTARRVCLVICASLALAGCSDDETTSAPVEPACPNDVATRANLAAEAVTGFGAYLQGHLDRATPACGAIVEDLGGSAPPFTPSMPSVEELATACGQARSAVTVAVMDQAVFMIDIPITLCPPDPAARADCLAECGAHASCEGLCEIKARVETTCEPLMITVTAATEFKETLETNLPSIAPLEVENTKVREGVTELDGALTDLLVELDADPDCSTLREVVTTSKNAVPPLQTDHAAASGTVANLLDALLQE